MVRLPITGVPFDNVWNKTVQLKWNANHICNLNIFALVLFEQIKTNGNIKFKNRFYSHDIQDNIIATYNAYFKNRYFTSFFFNQVFESGVYVDFTKFTIKRSRFKYTSCS